MRDKIKLAATDLITRRGYHAVTFREIAEAVKTTRANMHYHFGSKDQLIEEVWDEHWWGPTKTLDVHIASLRKKLAVPGLIATVRGVGYRLDPAE